MRSYIAGLFLFGMLIAAGSTAWAGERAVVKRQAASYPELAKRMRVGGMVKLEVKVDAAGKVEEVKVLSGHPLLGTAAKEAVKGWSYSPADAATVEMVEIEFKL